MHTLLQCFFFHFGDLNRGRIFDSYVLPLFIELHETTTALTSITTLVCFPQMQEHKSKARGRVQMKGHPIFRLKIFFLAGWL